jgi:hypothetical protein
VHAIGGQIDLILAPYPVERLVQNNQCSWKWAREGYNNFIRSAFSIEVDYGNFTGKFTHYDPSTIGN